jgi:hypothetical protein
MWRKTDASMMAAVGSYCLHCRCSVFQAALLAAAAAAAAALRPVNSAAVLLLVPVTC